MFRRLLILLNLAFLIVPSAQAQNREGFVVDHNCEGWRGTAIEITEAGVTGAMIGACTVGVVSILPAGAWTGGWGGVAAAIVSVGACGTLIVKGVPQWKIKCAIAEEAGVL